MKPQKKHHFEQIMNITEGMTRTASTQITKPESNTDIAEIKKLHKDLTNRIQQQTEQTTEVKPFVVEERVYLRTNNIHVKQRSKKLNNKSIKPFKIKRNIKLSYELDLLKKM
jgi:hypothetical protein